VDAVDVSAPGEDSLRAELRALVKQRDEMKAAAREAEKRAKAAADAEAMRLREAGEWEGVAKRYEAELAEYRPRIERLSQLEEREAKRLEAVRDEADKLSAKLPREIRDSLPGEIDPDAKLRMVRALHDTVIKRPTAAAPTAAPSDGASRVPAYGTPEFLEWQRKAPLDEVRAARKGWLASRLNRSE
jgi:hypothetical protein